MNEFAFASIKTTREALDAGRINVSELRSFYLKRFKQYDAQIGSALEIFDADSIPLKELKKGPLYGIAGIVKDNICQQGRIVACASKMLEHYRAPYNATAVTRLEKAGAYSLGRANCDEFAMGSSTEKSAFKKTRNPWNAERVPGGSSGGSIVAVAAGFVSWALGSDTGGSVRQPATLCGIVGLKPTYGLISRYGLIPYASSFDQIGPATRTVYDNALVLSALAGQDKQDSTTCQVGKKDYTQQLTGKLKPGFTLGIVENALEAEGFDPDVYKALNEALKEFERLGAQIKRLKFPMMEHATAAYFMISRAEAASNLARFDGVRYGYRSPHAESLTDMYTNTRNEGFGIEVKSRILVGTYVLSVGHADAFYRSAKIVQGCIREEFVNAFKEVDLLFIPGSPIPAFPFGAFDDNQLQMDLLDSSTAMANIAGLPALAVPCGFTPDTMPIGFQLMGPDLSEEALYQAAYAYEQATPWHTKHPQLS